MKPHREVVDKIVKQWLEKAEQDMKSARVLLFAEQPLLYPSCFHAQQAAEKYLKALLTKIQIEFPKTHAIERLLELLRPHCPEVSETLMEAMELTPYGVEMRYPGDMPEPSPQEAANAVSLAQMVQENGSV